MSWFQTDEEAIQLAVEAAGQAHREEHTVFVSCFRAKTETRTVWAVPTAAAMIEGVEGAGWQLSHVSESQAGDFHAQMTCVFRRR